MSKNNYEDRFLTRLVDDFGFGKYELVQALWKRLRARDIEIGQLESEVDYLNDKLKKINIKINQKAKKELRKEVLYERLERDIRVLEHQRNDLFAKNYKLENELKMSDCELEAELVY
ncbi:MAG: hypothetical protein KAG96_03920 [Ichthyobacteriaceae bacterium]|nr:hypothetical protein [Ichthyobacteriaceae bacterium]